MQNLLLAYRYLRHRLQARSWRAFHSPYLYRLFEQSCDERNKPPLSGGIEAERKRLLASNDKLVREDYGAGSLAIKHEQRQRISVIAAHALSRPYQCRFMARMAQHAGAKTIIELGTSLGISAAYLAAGIPGGRVITIEGDPAIADQAGKIFDRLSLANIELITGTFESILKNTDHFPGKIDLLFLDGNHRSDALQAYYEALLPHIHAGTIMIVDDIYWSADMTAGWRSLLQRPEVTQSADCFYFGLLFFTPDFFNKEHHRVRLPLRAIHKK